MHHKNEQVTSAATRRNEDQHNDEQPFGAPQQEQSQRTTKSMLASTTESVTADVSSSPVEKTSVTQGHEQQLLATATTAMRLNDEDEDIDERPWSHQPEQSQRRQPSSFTIESVAAHSEVSFPVAHDTDSISNNVNPGSLRQQSASFTIESVTADPKVSFPVAHDTDSLSNNVLSESVKSRSARDAVTDGDRRVATSRPPCHNVPSEIGDVTGTTTGGSRIDVPWTISPSKIGIFMPDRVLQYPPYNYPEGYRF
jgi:hypothetical protein